MTIFETQSAKYKVVRSVEHQVHAHSYWHELEVFYYALKNADDTQAHPHENTQLMDCKGELTKLKGPTYKPGHIMDTYMDFIMAYKQLLQHTKYTVKLQWVKGHADENKKAKPDSITKLERGNIKCDEAAKDY